MKKTKLLLLFTALFFAFQSSAKVIEKEKTIDQTENISGGFIGKNVLAQAVKKYNWNIGFCRQDTGINKNSSKATDKTPKFDSVEANQEPRNYYIAFSTNAFVKTVGGFKERFSPSFEVGRTYGIFEVGLASGRLNYIKKGVDTTRFIEFRPTINVFQKAGFRKGYALVPDMYLKQTRLNDRNMQ